MENEHHNEKQEGDDFSIPESMQDFEAEAPKKKKFYKKWWFWTIVVIVILIIVGIFSGNEPKEEYNTFTALKSDLIQEVSVTGTVQPADAVELAFESSGKVAAVYAKVGDSVKKGQLIVAQASADLYAQLTQARASVESAKALLTNYQSALAAQQAKLDEYKLGTRTEEITIAQTSVNTAEQTLDDAETNLENVQVKAEADLQEELQTTAASLADSINTGLTALFTFTDIQDSYFSDYDSNGYLVSDAKARAVESLLGHSNGGRLSKNSLKNLIAGAKGLTATAENNPTEANINAASTSTKTALMHIRTAFNSIPLTNLSATDITTINTQKSAIDTEISNVATKENSINVQKATNQSSIDSAKATVNDSKNALQAAKDNLALKQAGYTTEQLAAQEANVKLAEANVRSQQAQVQYAQANVNNNYALIGKKSITAPINGLVTMQEAKVGEIVGLNTVIVKVMSDAKFEIEANIAEVDIANVKVGDKAQVTLDAYGSDKNFSAEAISIDPAETVIDGVPTYKVTLQFEEESADIKSGMTANLDILTANLKDVVNIPQRAVLNKNGIKKVRLLNNNETVTEVEVATGLRGSDGNIEIINGVSEGDVVVVSVKNGNK